MNEVFLELKDISKRFGDVKVIEGINIILRSGMVYALAGENGAGKSTLSNIISGALRPSGGTLCYKGQEYSAFDISFAKQIGIKMVHQELQVLPLMSVTDNIFIGEETTKGVFLDKAAMRAQAVKLMAQVGLDIDPDMKLGDLEIAGRQLVEIARALNHEAKLIILDEPTSSLTSREIEKLFAAVYRLKAQGVSFLFISHRLEEIFELTDEVIVLKDGGLVAQEKTSDLNQSKLIQLMVGRSYSDYYNRKRTCFGEEALRVEDLSTKRKGVYHNAYLPQHVSFSVQKGEVLGIAGLVGAGRTELIRAICGILETDSGKIFVDGKEVQVRSPADAIALGMAWVTENRKEGLLLDFSLRDNIAITTLKRNLKGPFINDKKHAEIAKDYVERLRIKTTGISQTVRRLSGGNQQKVVLGKWLSTQPKVLILDEPTRGIDVNAKAQVYALINELTAQGIAVVLISSELPEVIGISDRILVMYEGKISGEVQREDFSETHIMEFATGRMAQQ